MAKSTKAEAEYQDRSTVRGERCAICTMFVKPRSCTAVAGDIDPNGRCKYFERAKRNTRMT